MISPYTFRPNLKAQCSTVCSILRSSPAIILTRSVIFFKKSECLRRTMEANGFHQHGPRHNIDHGFKNFDHEPADVILAVAFNLSGTRIALGSADHKIRVYDVEQDETPTLVDQWRGHDAEVTDASLPDLP